MSRSLLLSLLVTAASLAAPAALAQVCNDITLRTQADVDAFACTSVESLTISTDVGSTDPITSLEGLAELTAVDYSLFIQNNAALTSLDGLENLSSIGDNFLQSALFISDNAALTSLSGLEGLTFIGETLVILDNDALTSLDGLENLSSVGVVEIRDNDALTSLGGLSGFTSFVGSLSIQNNAALTSLEGLENLTSVEGSLFILDNDALTSLVGLEGLTSVGDLYVGGNAALTSLAGLEGLTSVGGFGSLSIQDNAALTSLTGLENLTSVIDLSVRENAMLNDCACGLSGLISGDPPMFTGVDAAVIVASNAPDGACTSPEVVLDASVDAMCMPVASEPTAGVPDRFALSAPYPNPFRGTATVGFAVPEASDVRLVVYDVLGREVAVVLDGPVAAGRYEAVLDGAGLPSGVYLVRMTTEGGFAQTQRVTLMR